MPGPHSNARDRALELLQQALATGVRGKQRDALKYAINVFEDDGRQRITDVHLRNLRPGDKPLKIPGYPGLVLVANKKAKVWRQRLMVNGVEKSITLGTWPTLSMAQAMTTWERNRDGEIDPETVDALEQGLTVKDLAKKYIGLARGDDLKPDEVRKRSWAEDNRQLNIDVIPEYGDRAASSITSDDIAAMLQGCIDRGSPRSAEKLLALLRFMFNVALGQGKGRRWLAATDIKIEPWLTGKNPCDGVVLPDRDPGRGEPLSEKQLRSYLRKLPAATMNDAIRDALTIQLLTCSRLGEVLGMTWAEVDLKAKVWTLPAARAKNKQAHRVMLPKQAVEILKRRRKTVPTEAVFPAPRSEKKLISTEYAGRILAANRGHLGVPERFSSHWLRHTCLSHLAGMKAPREVRDRVSNHRPPKSSDMDARYNAHEYDKEARAWLQKWADRLDALAGDRIISKGAGNGL
jgi:integrase